MSIVQDIKNRRQGKSGFTLLEVLLVVAIIAILAGIVIIAINPGKNLGDSRNSQRSADVNTILNAVYQYALDNNGAIPAGVPVAPAVAGEICSTATCSGLVDLSVLTTAGKYLVSIPKDPQCGTAGSACTATNGTNYKIVKETSGRVTVNAPGAEQGKTITVSK